MKSLRLSAPVYVCLSLCSLAYLRNHIPKLPNFLSILSLGLWPWLGPSCSGDAIRCVLPVLWTTQILRDSTGNNTGRGGVWVYRSGVLWWPYLSVCLCMCLLVWNYTSDLYQFLCACSLWLWLGPPLAVLRYVMYLRFYGWRIICTTWPPSWWKHSPHAALDLAINGA